MVKHLALITILSLFTQVALVNAYFQIQPASRDEKRATKIKDSIRKLGVGKDARTEVRLIDDRKIAGFIKESNDTQFVIENPKTGSSDTIRYTDVKSLKGKNMSIGTKILIGVGIVAGAFLFITVLFDD